MNAEASSAALPLGAASDGEGERTTLVVEVAWSLAPRQLQRVDLVLPRGATLADALEATGWPAFEAARAGDEAFGAAGLSAAVWGRARPLAQALRDGDRVEVLRGLAADPMDARRVRYKAAGGVKALRRRQVAAQDKS